MDEANPEAQAQGKQPRAWSRSNGPRVRPASPTWAVSRSSTGTATSWPTSCCSASTRSSRPATTTRRRWRSTSKVLLEFGFDRLVGGGKAYVKAPLGFMQQAIYRFLPNNRTVLEVGNEDNADDLLPGVREARKAGYAVAHRPLPRPARVRGPAARGRRRQDRHDRADRPAACAPSSPSCAGTPAASIVAEKVETREQHQFLRGLPVDLFQGYYFARPALLSTERIPVHTLVLLELAGALQDHDLDLQKVARLVAAEPRVSRTACCAW